MKNYNCDVVVVGAGPAGMAAAISAKKNGAEQVIVIERENRLGGILWIVKNYPQLSDGQIARLMRSTNPTVASVRNKTHSSYSVIQIQSPIVLGLVSESAIHDAVAKAEKQANASTKKKKK